MLGELLGLDTSAGSKGKEEAFRVAAAALLVETASVDDRFDEAERAVIGRLLQERFGVAADEARRLLQEGQRSRDASAQLYGFTRAVNERLDPAGRIALIEMLWEVALADGVLDPFEDTLLRRVGGLVDVPDRERGLARQRVLARRGAGATKTETKP
jgi:uncharacterized tellurite resistance protein B-like protein